MTQSPLLQLPLVPRVIAVSFLAAALMGCAPTARAQSPAQLASASSPAAAPVTAAAASAATRDSTPPMVNGVEMSGVNSTIALERPVTGHLVSLNGRYKLRGTMTIFEPGGYMGAHHHAGPGLRYVLAGELTYVEAGRTHVFRRGDWFYESGDTLNTAANRSAERDTILNFEILPADWYGASTMPAPGSH
jgi:quercetin dioxygenase-like cupin family protein